ncbi:MAG: hypothetical protein HKN72_15325 [Gemmatimonadetes bacterium]|nr:hypothetical protein [Gemmatimonadota bacterium]
MAHAISRLSFSTMGTNVPRIGRILDAVGLLFFLMGGGVFVRAWIGFRSVPDFQRSLADVPTAAVQYADGFWRLQKIGAVLMIVGVCVFVGAWLVARRRSTS